MILLEKITDADLKKIESSTEKKIKSFFKNDEFKKVIEKIVDDKLKDKKNKKRTEEITKEVLSKLYKTLWTKKGFWLDSL